MATDLTGFWYCLEDSGFYYLRQIDDVLWWVGMSTDQGMSYPLSLQNGLRFCNVFQGKVDGSNITGDWADVPRGLTMSSGTLSLLLESGGGLDSGEGFGLRLTKQDGTGGFTGTTWVPFSVLLPGPPMEINAALEQIFKCVTRWDCAHARYERETLHWNFGDAIKDSVVLFGTLAPPADVIGIVDLGPDFGAVPIDLGPPGTNPISDGYPYNRAPSLDYFWDNPDNHGDCDVTFYLNVDQDAEKLSPDFIRTIPARDQSDVQNKISQPIECELIMYSRHEKNGVPLRPGWAESNGNSILVNGRPLNGNVVADANGYVTSIGNLPAKTGQAVRVIGAFVWDVGHYDPSTAHYVDRGVKLEIHPVYALDIITTVSPADISGAWATSDGGTCYLRQLADNTIWFFWMPQFGVTNYARVFLGSLNGNTITGNWADLPLGGQTNSGTLTLTVQSGRTRLQPDSGGAFSDQPWIKLYDIVGAVCPIAQVLIKTRPKVNCRNVVLTGAPLTLQASVAPPLGTQPVFTWEVVGANGAPTAPDSFEIASTPISGTEFTITVTATGLNRCTYQAKRTYKTGTQQDVDDADAYCGAIEKLRKYLQSVFPAMAFPPIGPGDNFHLPSTTYLQGKQRAVGHVLELLTKLAQLSERLDK